jgi:hypothetical protein
LEYRHAAEPPCPKFTQIGPGAIDNWISQWIAMFSSERLYC